MFSSLMRRAALSVAALTPMTGVSFGQQLLLNPDVEVANAPPGWTLLEVGGNPPSPRESATLAGFANQEAGGVSGLWLEAFQGLFFGNGAEPTTAVLSQTVPGVAGENYTFSGYSLWEGNYSGGVTTLDAGSPSGAIPSPTQSSFELAFLNGSGGVIGAPVALDLRTVQTNGGGWAQHTLNGLAPAGTANVRVTASAINMVPNIDPQQSGFYDTFSLRGASSPAVEALTNADLNIGPDPNAPNWVGTGPHSYQGFSAHSGGSGFWLESYQASVTPLDGSLLQTVAATAGTTYELKGWSLFEGGYSGGVTTLDPNSPYGAVPSLTDTLFVLEFLDSTGTQVGGQTFDLRTEQTNGGGWKQHTVTGVAPAGTTQLRAGVRVDDMMANIDMPFQTANFDDFSLRAVPAGVLGDTNSDGIVNLQDLNNVKNNFGLTGSPVLGDARGAIDGVVNLGDLNAVKNNFGQTNPGATAIPEPSTALGMLMACGACGLVARKRG
ncbi:MAG: PEP-CTERM sorting domain-containing protein [Lacipirellulaceae bacterium]